MAEGNLPIGFIMSIALNKKALKNFVNLNDNEKNMICTYIQNSTSGDDAKQRIDISIKGLENSSMNFLN